MIYACLLVILVIGGQWTVTSATYTTTDAESLITALTSSYSSDVRPAEQTIIELDMGLIHITELNIVSQVLSMVGFLLVKWEDSRLTWTSSSYNNLSDIVLPFSNIWTPPLVLNNAAFGITFMNDDSDLASAPVKIWDTGNLVWMVPANFMSQCSVNIAYYPFDTQECDITVSTWLYNLLEIGLFTTRAELNLDLYEENGDWEIVDSSTTNTTRTLYGYPMAAVTFTITLERKNSYYITNLLLPVIFLALLGPFVFILPVESGEKIGFALTILLSMSVVMTTVSDRIPTAATHVCILSIYLLVTFLVCIMETLVTVLTCRIHDFHNKGYRPSSRAQAMLRCWAKLTFYRRADTDTGKVENVRSESKVGVEVNVTEKAWKEMESDDGNISDYTYEEFAAITDRINFVIFFILTTVVTVGFMIRISTVDS